MVLLWSLQTGKAHPVAGVFLGTLLVTNSPISRILTTGFHMLPQKVHVNEQRNYPYPVILRTLLVSSVLHFVYNMVNTSFLPHGLHLMLCSNLLLGPTLLPLQRGGCTLSTRLAWWETPMQLKHQGAQLKMFLPVRLLSFDGIYSNRQMHQNEAINLLCCWCLCFFSIQRRQKQKKQNNKSRYHQTPSKVRVRDGGPLMPLKFRRSSGGILASEPMTKWKDVRTLKSENWCFQEWYSRILDGYLNISWSWDDQLLLPHVRNVVRIKTQRFFRH